MSVRWLLLPVLMVGCGKGDDSKPPSTPPPPAPTSKANAHADASDAKALPAAGMVCRGDKAFVWTEDDTVEPLRAIRPAPGRDGQVYETYESVHSLAAGSKPVKYQGDDTAPAVAITSPTSLLVQVSPTRVDVFRDGTWKQIELPRLVAEAQAVEVGGDWLLAGGDAVVRVPASGRPELVATAIGQVRGILPVGGDLWLVTTSSERGVSSLTFLKGKASGGFRTVVTLPDVVNGRPQHAVGTDRAAIWLGANSKEGTVFLIDGAGTPTKIAEEVEELGAFDGQNRLWYRTRTALVARASDGALTEYPLASKPMLASRWSVMCFPFGGGFTKLPAPGPALTGRLTIEVTGAAKLPVVACNLRDSTGPTPCDTAPSRITGTFDEAGRWTTAIPIGNYAFAVQQGSAWLEPAFDAKTKRTCEVKPDKDCTLTARMP